MPEAVAEELCVKFQDLGEIQEFAQRVNQFHGDVDLKQEEMELQVFNGDQEELKELIEKFLV